MTKEISNVEPKEVGLSQAWEEKLASYAVEAKDFVDSAEEPGMRFFSTKDKILRWDDEEIPHNTLVCVILTHCYVNTLYTKSFKSDDKSPPACFSIGVDGETLSPHENSEEPVHATCKGCPNLEWSSGTGLAKACSNKIRLAILPAGSYGKDDNPKKDNPALIKDPSEYSKNKIGYLIVPPTSIKNYKKYVNSKLGKVPPFAMFTQIELVAEGFQITFKPIKPIKDISILEALEPRLKEAQKEILTPYEKIESEDADAEDKPTKY